jgi:hypothetical protein
MVLQKLSSIFAFALHEQLQLCLLIHKEDLLNLQKEIFLDFVQEMRLIHLSAKAHSYEHLLYGCTF